MTNEQLQKIWQFAGIKKVYYEDYDEGKEYPMFIPSGKPWRTHKIDAMPVPDFVHDMNACIRLIMPKLKRWEAGSNPDGTVWFKCDDPNVAEYPIEATANRLSLAFCLAADKYFGR
jgi:hypothetical protein